MVRAGIDIGSRTVKLVLMEDGEIIQSQIVENSFNPIEICQGLLKKYKYDAITATGYGRHLFARYFECDVISEIKAFALGSRREISECRMVLDIGGQDTKAIALDDSGRMNKFEMNDRCAAGTGRFLEIMAMALGYSLQEFSRAATQAHKAEIINSMCTVFAESEIISLVARGAAREEVALGIHQAIVKRTAAMLQRVSINREIAFVGGVAHNHCIRQLLETSLGHPVIVPRNPQLIGALGCAINNGNGKISRSGSE